MRTATGQKAYRPGSPGTLKEWHWRAMAEVWKARPEGLNNEGGDNYGRSGWNTWLQLRNDKERREKMPRIEEYQTWKQGEFQRSGTGSWRESRPVYWIGLTPLGEQFSHENWQ